MSDKKRTIMTKDELLAEIARMDGLISEKDQRIEEMDGEIKELNASGEGWLVMAPSPLFSGLTMGVQFVNGQAFIRKNQPIPACEHEPLKESTFTKEGYKPEEIKAIKAREAMPSAERAALEFEKDFGYEVVLFDGSEGADAQMKKLVDQRAKEYSEALEVLEARKKAESAMMPSMLMG